MDQRTVHRFFPLLCKSPFGAIKVNNQKVGEEAEGVNLLGFGTDLIVVNNCSLYHPFKMSNGVLNDS